MSPAYERALRAAQALTPNEQQQLIAVLQQQSQLPNNLSSEEWWALVETAQYSIPPGPLYSDRREDWYDDNGR